MGFFVPTKAKPIHLKGRIYNWSNLSLRETIVKELQDNVRGSVLIAAKRTNKYTNLKNIISVLALNIKENKKIKILLLGIAEENEKDIIKIKEILGKCIKWY